MLDRVCATERNLFILQRRCSPQKQLIWTASSCHCPFLSALFSRLTIAEIWTLPPGNQTVMCPSFHSSSPLLTTQGSLQYTRDRLLTLKSSITAEVASLGGHSGLNRLIEGLDRQLEGLDLSPSPRQLGDSGDGDGGGMGGWNSKISTVGGTGSGGLGGTGVLDCL